MLEKQKIKRQDYLGKLNQYISITRIAKTPLNQIILKEEEERLRFRGEERDGFAYI